MDSAPFPSDDDCNFDAIDRSIEFGLGLVIFGDEAFPVRTDEALDLDDEIRQEEESEYERWARESDDVTPPGWIVGQ